MTIRDLELGDHFFMRCGCEWSKQGYVTTVGVVLAILVQQSAPETCSACLAVRPPTTGVWVSADTVVFDEFCALLDVTFREET